MEEVLKYTNCFICGDKNQNGINAKFYFDGKQAITEIITDEKFEGYKGIYHGGIISSILDEVMIKAILAQGIFPVTAELKIRFISPVKIGEKITFSGRIIKKRGRIFFTEGKAKGAVGEIFATATAKYVEANEGLKEQLMKSID